ncbi:hypothetical protein WCLP8_5100003 [uncultured Gammaproteobacteria bacterium]
MARIPWAAGVIGVAGVGVARAEAPQSLLEIIERDPTLTAVAWTLVVLGGLFLVAAGVVLPAVLKALKVRDQRIAEELARAERVRADMEQISVKLVQQAAQAQDLAQEMRNQALREIDVSQKAELEAMNTRIDQEVKAAEERIVAATRSATEGIPAASDALVKEFLIKLES